MSESRPACDLAGSLDQKVNAQDAPQLLSQQLEAAKRARGWVDTEMLPNDWVAVMSYDTRLKVQQDLTHNHQALIDAIGDAMKGGDREGNYPSRINPTGELPEALQHRHPPEPGVRHAIMVEPDTLMASLYGEGEIVVNSEHRQAIQRLAQGFHIGARALDGVLEAIEWTKDSWFALGVQWQPAAGTASGLDIQVFRGVIDAAQSRRHVKPMRAARRLAVSA